MNKKYYTQLLKFGKLSRIFPFIQKIPVQYQLNLSNIRHLSEGKFCIYVDYLLVEQIAQLLRNAKIHNQELLGEIYKLLRPTR